MRRPSETQLEARRRYFVWVSRWLRPVCALLGHDPFMFHRVKFCWRCGFNLTKRELSRTLRDLRRH